MPLSTKQKNAVKLILLAAYWSVLFWGTHRTLTHPPIVQVSDKFVHVVAYTGLGLLLAVVLNSFWQSDSTQRASFLIVIAYGVIDELTQLVVGRRAEFTDWFADVLGGLIGVYLLAPFVVRYQSATRN